MTGATLPVKLVAVVMAIGVVSGFATGSITYAAFSDTEDASVSISAGSNWGSGDTGAGDQSDISVVDLEVKPDPVPRSRGTFTIDLVVDSATIDSVSDGTLHVTESPESILHAEKLIAHDENTSDNRSTVSMKFDTALLFQYVDVMDEVDATVSITLDGGTEVSAAGTILLKGKSTERSQTPNAGPEVLEQADANNSTATDDTVSNRTSTSNTTDGENPLVSGKNLSDLATANGTDDLANRTSPGNTTDTAAGTDTNGTNLTAENGTVAVDSGSEAGSTSTNETSIGEMNETTTDETNFTTTDTTNETTTDETNSTTSTNPTDDGNTSDFDGNQTTVTDSTETDTLPFDPVSQLRPMAQILVDPTLGTDSILEQGPRVPVQDIPVDLLEIRVDTVVATIIH